MLPTLEQFKLTNPTERDAFSVLIWQSMAAELKSAIDTGTIPRLTISVAFELMTTLQTLAIGPYGYHAAHAELHNLIWHRALRIFQKNEEFE